MNRILLALAAFCLVALSGCMTLDQNDASARQAALDWLALVDAGKYHQAYIDRPPRILAASNEENFLRFMQGRRAPFGRAISRAFFRVMPTKHLNGAPDGNYEIIYFKTHFEHKANGYEGVTMTGENGRWQVSGYSIH